MIKLYHVATGEENETHASFKSGASSGISNGHGQGAGFYVWTTQENARGHLSFLEREGFVKSRSLILECEAQTPLNHAHWNIDYEIHAPLLAQFLWGNYELVRKLPDNSIRTERGFFQPSRFSRSDRYQTLTLRCINGFSKSISTQTEGDVGTAHLLSVVFDAMQQAYPSITFEAKRKWLSNINTLRALKYTGSDSLPILSFEVCV